MTTGRPRLPLPDVDHLAAEVRAGDTMTEIAARYDCSASTIQRAIAHAGYDGRTGEPRTATTEPTFTFPDFDTRPWMEQARCAQANPETFFPEKGGSARDAKAVCMRCPVRAECLDDALTRREPYGIFGGLTPRERAKLLRGAV